MRRTLRALLIVAAVFGAGAARAEFVNRPLTGVSFGTAVTDAQKLADARPGAQVMRIEGRSMLPFFGEGSVVVVRKIDPAKLRAGMVVVYTNRFGETVAHRLVATTEGGWTAQGYNNESADSTVVNGSNLQGVVYATFQSSGLADSIAIADLIKSIPSALAAPAR